MKCKAIEKIGLHYMRGVWIVLLAVCLVFAISMDFVCVDISTVIAGHSNDEENSPFSPPGGPSAFGQFVVEGLPEDLMLANENAFEGCETWVTLDAGQNNSISADVQQDNSTFDVPTNGVPSPLFGAQAFSQQMLRFEEFGTEKLKLKCLKKPKHWNELPAPADAQSAPDGNDLEDFLSQCIWPKPRKVASDSQRDHWEPQIESYLGHDLSHPPAEGRPPGLGWSHQRWDEFKSEIYFQTAMAGSRTNVGSRDSKQDHSYSQGEFGPGGLYHNTTGAPGSEGTTNGIRIKFHPNMPLQAHETLWTFDGTLPPKLLKVRYGGPILMRHYNALPIDVADNRGFGVHTITTHEHSGSSLVESDGLTNAFYFPGQFYDYCWPIALAGHDSVNNDASDSRAGTPDGNGGIKNIAGDYRETISKCD